MTISTVYDLVPMDCHFDNHTRFYIVIPIPLSVTNLFPRLARENVTWQDFKMLVQEAVDEILACPDMVHTCPVDPDLSVYANARHWAPENVMRISEVFREMLQILYHAIAFHGLFYDEGGMARCGFGVHSLRELNGSLEMLLFYYSD